jgi:hypothetical protein
MGPLVRFAGIISTMARFGVAEGLVGWGTKFGNVVWVKMKI